MYFDFEIFQYEFQKVGIPLQLHYVSKISNVLQYKFEI